jgi:hypothetical protein
MNNITTLSVSCTCGNSSSRDSNSPMVSVEDARFLLRVEYDTSTYDVITGANFICKSCNAIIKLL